MAGSAGLSVSAVGLSPSAGVAGSAGLSPSVLVAVSTDLSPSPPSSFFSASLTVSAGFSSSFPADSSFFSSTFGPSSVLVTVSVLVSVF